MYNLYAKFEKILEICKQFSQGLVDERGNVPRRGLAPKFCVRKYAKELLQKWTVARSNFLSIRNPLKCVE